MGKTDRQMMMMIWMIWMMIWMIWMIMILMMIIIMKELIILYSNAKISMLQNMIKQKFNRIPKTQCLVTFLGVLSKSELE